MPPFTCTSLHGSDPEAAWEEDAPVCSRLAMSLDTSITRRYLGSVSMLTVSAVMYVNYRIPGEFILISILLSIPWEGERAEKDRDVSDS